MMNKRVGFSLIEILVAMVSVGLLVAAVMRLIATGYQQFGVAQRSMDAQLNAQIATQTILQQLRGISGTGYSSTGDKVNPFQCSACHGACFNRSATYGAVLQGKIDNCTSACHASETPSVYDENNGVFSDAEADAFLVSPRRIGKVIHPLAVYIRTNPDGEANQRIDFGADFECNATAGGICVDVHTVERRSLYTRNATATEDPSGRKVLVLEVNFGGGEVTQDIVAYAIEEVRFDYIRTLGEEWLENCYPDPADPSVRDNCETDANTQNDAFSAPIGAAINDSLCLSSDPESAFDWDSSGSRESIKERIEGVASQPWSPSAHHPLGFRLYGIRVSVRTVTDNQTTRFALMSYARPRILNLRRFGGN